MAYVSKTWVDRDSQYPTRRVLVHSDLSEEQVTVRRDEGIITTQGDVFDANTMNNLEARIAAGIGEKQNTLTAGSGISIENDVISATGGGGGSSTLAGLDDTNISSPQNGQALIYDAASSKWVNANGGSGSATLAGLTDVTLTTPTADQVLKYDGTKWVNGEGGGGDVELSNTLSGSVCSFTDGADGLPVKDLIAQVVAVQSGTGDPSPSNVRPISGWSSVNVKRCSKNLIDIASLATTNITYSNGVLTGTGLAFSQAYSNGFISVPTTGQITVTLTARTTTGTTSNNGLVVRFKYTDGTQASLNFSNDTTTWETKTITSNASKVVSYVLFTYAYESANTWEIKDLQVELGASSTAVESYNGTTTNVSLGQTVFGGELDVTSGVLKITHGFDTFDGDSVTSVSEVSGAQYVRVLASALSIDGATTRMLCDSYNPVDVSANGNIRWVSRSQQVVRIFDSRFTTIENAQAILNAQPVHLCYELATPVTVQLTPIEVTTLLGGNNIWCDTGDTEVEYYTSTATDVIDLVQYDTTKQDKLTAGTGISIDSNNVISATGGGGGAVIDDTTTSTTSVWSSSKTNSEIATKQNALTAGFGINIDSNSGTISYDLIDDDVSDTLYAGVTSMTLSSQTILYDSLIDIYVENGGAYPTDTVVNGTNVILIFEAQATDINVRMIVHHSHRP